MDFITYLAGEAKMIGQAPVTYAVTALIIGLMVYLWVRHQYADRIASVEGRLQLRDDKIADYEKKLEGASPDEAQAQIAALRGELAAVASYGLSGEGLQRLKDALVGVSGSINIYKNADASDADRLYRQTVTAFRAMGWTVNSHAISGIADTPDSGVTLIYWDATDQTLVERVRHALDVAGLNPGAQVNPTGWGTETNLTIVFSSRDPDWVPPGRFG